MKNRKNYTICLSNWESVLPELCSLIEAPYQSGELESFEEDFVSTGNNEAHWQVLGKTGCEISIILEKYESYFFGTLSGDGDAFRRGTLLLWETYLEQGGNPEAQEKP